MRPIFVDEKQPMESYICRYRGQLTQVALEKIEQWRGQLDNLVEVVWQSWREIESWDDTPRELRYMFASRPLIGLSVQIVERFLLTYMW